ncbi:MAG: sugar phosphate nucleotidyltransferase [Bacteroidota bacterium]|nr:sugar phosphate nucleotidyltransferase [Bacteroidota bacterium]
MNNENATTPLVANTKSQKTVIKAMILAAGIGSRLKPWTDFHPKALALVNGKSLLQRNIEYLQQYGIRQVVVNVHHFAKQVLEAIEKSRGWGSDITVSDETDGLLETGGGLLKAACWLQDTNPIVLMNVDILTELNLEAMIGYHQEKKPLATLATTDRETSRYFLFDQGNNLCGWRNVKTGEEKTAGLSANTYMTQKAFSGIHILEPGIFSLIKRQGRFSMVDVYLDLMKEHTIKSFDHSESRIIDVGKPDSIAKAEQMFSV